MDKITGKINWFLEIGGIKKDIVFLIISAAALVISIFDLFPLPFDAAWAAIFLCGVPIIIEAGIGLITELDVKADLLVSIALVASIIIGEDFAAGEVAFIMQLGALLEDLTVAKAREGIEKLVNLTPQTARVMLDGTEKIINAKDVKAGDIIRILSGETVPVDGIIIGGQTCINQAVITGESLPVDKYVGDEVFSGAVNQLGAFEIKAIRCGEDSTIQRMIKLVQSADAGRSKIVGLADRWATWIVFIALFFSVITWLFTGQIIRAVTILVVFCPCALVLATPTAIMAAIGNATKHGFLVREGDSLERLSMVSKVTFDKTGTLTYGIPKVIKIKNLSQLSEDDFYRIVASAEQLSEHPIGKALVSYYKQSSEKNLIEAQNFQVIPGKGVLAVIDGKKVLAGNKKLFLANGVKLSSAIDLETEKHFLDGGIIIYVSIDNDFSGYIVLSDIVRNESLYVIDSLFRQNVQPILLTGDNENTAKAIARELCIEKIYANCLPEDKLRNIELLQSSGENVCMIGDGINDAPALKKANVGIAMGVIGSDIAVDAADIVLVDDEIKELPHLLLLSKRMMNKIKQNMVFSMLLNFIAIAMAMTGALNPVIGALVHNAGSILVIVNSALLLNWKDVKNNIHIA